MHESGTTSVSVRALVNISVMSRFRRLIQRMDTLSRSQSNELNGSHAPIACGRFISLRNFCFFVSGCCTEEVEAEGGGFSTQLVLHGGGGASHSAIGSVCFSLGNVFSSSSTSTISLMSIQSKLSSSSSDSVSGSGSSCSQPLS